MNSNEFQLKGYGFPLHGNGFPLQGVSISWCRSSIIITNYQAFNNLVLWPRRWSKTDVQSVK
jgi:hypothetical protein